MIKCILFDLGGVVVDFWIKQYFDYLGKVSGYSRKEVEKKLDYHWNMLELGLIHVKFFEREISDVLGIERSKVQWIEFYKKNMRINKKMMALVKALKKRYKVAFLSNVDHTKYDIGRSILDLKEFDYAFASCYMKKRKPDPEAYKYVLRKMHMKADEVIFIDNQYENVLGARSVGIKSIWFKGSKSELVRKLRKLGVEV
ncbi:MAG: HAD family hydrolase [Candidatus Micrarchaeales archaeon]